MCVHKKNYLNTNVLMAIAFTAALLSAYLNVPLIDRLATIVSEVFINILKCISIPLIFLSIVSTISSMDNVSEFKRLGSKVVKYTFLTTFIAAFVALAIFLIIDPARSQIHLATIPVDGIAAGQNSYMNYLIGIIPSNALAPFVENQVISVLFLALLASLAILSLPIEQRAPLRSLFSSLYAMIMKIASWIVSLMPIAIWSFVTLFFRDMRDGLEFSQLALYLSCVLIANLIQGFIVLPLFMKSKGVSPIGLAKGMLPALSVAFFTKSSSATLPMAIRCAEENVGLSKRVTSFAFPLCTTINMNACAAFILTTILFVSMAHGIQYSAIDYFMWAIIASIAAVGNAGVPMGCYFLASALLASMNVPLNLMGVILPFYAIIDMLETALNVWSDSAVVAVVDKEVRQEVAVPVTS